jgi:3-hydroxyacyl-CoA dehydrogenase
VAKAAIKQSVYRSAEALRHPKAGTKSSFSATSKAALTTGWESQR